MKTALFIFSIITLILSIFLIFTKGESIYYYGFFILSILNSIINISEYVVYRIEQSEK